MYGLGGGHIHTHTHTHVHIHTYLHKSDSKKPGAQAGVCLVLKFASMQLRLSLFATVLEISIRNWSAKVRIFYRLLYCFTIQSILNLIVPLGTQTQAGYILSPKVFHILVS